MAYLQLGLGIPLLLAGAWLLVRGASALALRLGIPELIIGLTIVAMGTSAPELMVSMLSAFQGATDLAVGNVLGSNISNILLILGVSALISPLAMEKGIRWREIPFTLLSTLMLAILANDRLFGQGENSLLVRGDGLVLLGFFAVYLYYLVSMSLKNKTAEVEDIPFLGMRRAALMVVIGVPALALGGQWIVNGATAAASALGMSEALIGLTILAVGTSLPELATSALAAMRGSADIAVGNVVGSNVFNLLWILGATATVKPIAYNPVMNQDLWFLLAVTLVFFLFTFTWKRHKIDRREGALFLVLYAGYLAYVIARG